MRIALEPEFFPWLDYHRYSFSLGVHHGSGIWLSGNTASAFDPATKSVIVLGGMAAQAAVAWDKVEATLAAVGLGLDVVTKVTEYVTANGLDVYGDAAEVRTSRLGTRHLAAVATIVVERLLRPNALLEVEVSASTSPEGDGVVQLGSLMAPEAGPDLSAQVRAVLIQAQRMLSALDMDLSHVVKTVEMTTPASRGAYRATAEVRRELLAPAFPAATGVLAPRLPWPDALVSMDVTASRHEKLPIFPYGPGRGVRGLTFSPAVRAGDLVFCSGATAIDPGSGLVVEPGNVAGQAKFVYSQLDAVLRAAGGSGLDDVVKTVEFVAPAAFDSYRSVAAVREHLLSRPPPAATGVVCGGLLRSDWLIEVDATAVAAPRPVPPTESVR